jgi:hypothetical protein
MTKTSKVFYSYKIAALAFIGSKFKGIYIGGEGWKNPRLEISRIKGNILARVGAAHLLTSVVPKEFLLNALKFAIYEC